MLTQCPSCETTFRVTAEILRVADGQVRCGRCHSQFDAMARLIEHGDPNAAETGKYLQTPLRRESEKIEVDEPEAREEITLEGKHIERSGTYRVLDGKDDSGKSHLREEVSEEWAEMDDDDGTIDSPDEESSEGIEVEESDLEEIAAEYEQPIEDEDDAPVAKPIRATRAPFGVRSAASQPEADDLALFETRAHRTASPLIWKILGIPLALLLVVQAIHHYRAELARHPRFGAPLMNAYQALGLNLTPDWNLHAYGVKQWGVVMDPASPGTLKVRASVTNGARFAQPYPLLKLVLEDRWGDQVRAREFDPVEYLDPGTASDRLLAPAQQTNATISIVDPGPDAEGFRFDVCLRGRNGPVCAAEVPQ